ncbi:transporter [Ameyamaea chiangmaiensis NBRC 103196]|uniref:MFS transporter n=2 Tax=Ameyamaea chiangmaiensis TaxID=442969 RepID=A0A850PGE0_9PROT|nr:MFS transporter [Ameyamaea chiangmaiensis]MBS4075634.1 MFS transporter [Ameyamaea chiangmaiensis]NVN41490.1 MFS transporter [Ameyamaea chiangmaiensis]GBQ70690.1 transporter [Ameyamaea chiangmaiensis NBRC 103196]
MTDAQNAAPLNVSALYRSVFMRIVPFLALGFLAAYTDRVNVSFAKLQMLGDLDMTDAGFGLGTGLFFIGYVFCEVPSNIILQRVGARRWLARILVTWGVVSSLSGFIHTPALFHLSRFALGVAEAGFMPGALYYLGQWVPAARRARVIALFMLGIPAASIISAPVSGWILTNLSGYASLAGWRWLFLIEGLPPILLGLWGWFALPDRIETASWLTPVERRYLAAELADHDSSPRKTALAAALADPRIWLIGIIDGGILLGLYTVAFWFPTLVRQHYAGDYAHLGLIVAIPHLAAAVSMIACGLSSDRSGERRWHLFVPVAIGAVSLALCGLPSTGVFWLVLFGALANAGLLGGLPALWAIPFVFLDGPAAAAGLALACSLANVAGFLATSLFGLALTYLHQPGIVMAAFAAIAFAASLLVFLIDASRRRG